MEKINFFNNLNDVEPNWTDYNLVMPCIGVGNVGQLSIDLLIATLLHEKKANLAGRIYSKSLQSISGPNAYDCNLKESMTTCEVYESKPLKLVIIQQRAPTFKERRKEYLKELTQWIKKCKFSLVVFLTSSFIQYLTTALLKDETFPMRYLTTSSLNQAHIDKLEDELKLNKLEKVKCYSKEESRLEIPGGGISLRMYKECEKQDIPALFLIIYCAEGDNREDAMALLKKLNLFFNIKKTTDNRQESWKVPVSWSSLFGSESPPFLY